MRIGVGIILVAALGLGGCPPLVQPAFAPPVDEPAFGWLQGQHGGGPIAVTYEVYGPEQMAACGVVSDGHEADAPRRLYAYRLTNAGAGEGVGWLGPAVTAERGWTEADCLTRLETLAP